MVVAAHGGVGGTGVASSSSTSCLLQTPRHPSLSLCVERRRPSPAWKLSASRVAEVVLLILAVCVV